MAPSRKKHDTGIVGPFVELRFGARWRSVSTSRRALDYDAGPPVAHVIADILDLEARRHPRRPVTYATLAHLIFGVRHPSRASVVAIQGEMPRVKSRLLKTYKRRLLRLGGKVRAAVDVADWRSVEGPRRKVRAESAMARFIEIAMSVDPSHLSQDTRRQFFKSLREIAQHRELVRSPDQRRWLTETLAKEWDRQ